MRKSGTKYGARWSRATNTRSLQSSFSCCAAATCGEPKTTVTASSRLSAVACPKLAAMARLAAPSAPAA